jgi:hypothetical protein
MPHKKNNYNRELTEKLPFVMIFIGTLTDFDVLKRLKRSSTT